MPGFTAPLDFTDGDTFKRFTVTNAQVSAQSDIDVSIRKHETVDADDAGWLYIPNVVSVANGSFDVNVGALVLGEIPVNDEGPNETIELVYQIQ